MGKVIPEDLQSLSSKLNGDPAAHLSQADSLLQAHESLQDSMYTTATVKIAVVYTLAYNFLKQEFRVKAEDLSNFEQTLRQTAQNWIDTEQANTPHS